MPSFPLSDGAHLHYHRAGDPSAGVTVVLAHGYALDHRSWRSITTALPRMTEHPVQVIAYDHRGHGQSAAATEGTATVAQRGDAMGELITGLAAGVAIVVGHAMGGLAAMALTQRHPGLVDRPASLIAGLMFLSTAAGGLPAEASTVWASAVGKVMRDLESLVGPRLLDLVGGTARKTLSTGLRWWLFGDDPRPADVDLTVNMVRSHWPNTIALFRTGLDSEDRADEDRPVSLNPAVAAPVTAVVGERDRIVPATHAEKLAGSVQRGTAVVLPGRGHMLPLEGHAELLPRIVAMVHAAQRDLGDQSG
jgi:pimeloyl-ACP methyl ester carboxylesterase